MYVPPKHSVDEDAAWGIVRAAGAGMLIRSTPGGLESVYVPVVVGDDCQTLLTHVARANRWWRSVNDGDDVLVIFLTASAYVSPSNYPSRLENPGVVPTWNYVAAEVRGKILVHDDPQWLSRQVRLVTKSFEENREPEWRVEDAPATYVDQQLKAIVGIEIQVISVQGKAKLSQNRSDVDHDAVRDSFAQGTLSERIVAARMNRDE